MTIAPPFAIFDDFLPDAGQRALADWALANRARFEPASVVDDATRASGGAVDPERRVASVTRDFGTALDGLRAAVVDRRTEICAAAGHRGAIPDLIELEVAAHGDGAHFFPHLDIPTGTELKAEKSSIAGRMISAVYYFHHEAHHFEGGALRLFGPATPAIESETPPPGAMDVEPIGNRLVVFPSWLVHQVRPVRCPSGRFEDHRLAVNCWLCRSTAN